MLNKIKKKITAILSGKFVRSVSILVGGTAFSQAIALLALPILTRLYTPEDFSILAVYTSVISIITVIACLRFEVAIPIPKRDKDGIALFSLSLISVVFITISTKLVIIFFTKQINQATEYKISEYLWLIPLGVFFGGTYNALQYWATRKKKYSLVAKTRMTQAISGNGAQLGFGFYGITPIGLLLGQVLNIGAGIFGLGRYFKINYSQELKHLKLKEIIDTFKAYDRFPKYSTWEAFANSGAIQIPVILIAYYAMGAEAGFLMLAMRLLSAPMSLIGGAVAQVYLTEAADKYNKGQLQSFTYKTIWSLVKIGAAPLIAAAAVSPFLIPILFGEEWHRTGSLISWMVPWFFMQFITSPISMTLNITNNQKTAMFLQVFGLILRSGGVLLTGLYFKEYISEAYAITGFIFYALYLIVVLSTLRKIEAS